MVAGSNKIQIKSVKMIGFKIFYKKTTIDWCVFLRDFFILIINR